MNIRTPARTVLALAIAAAALPAMADGLPGQPAYSRTVFFGDSLSDSGHFQNVLPAAVRPVTGKFTTNPGFVWAEWLADYYQGNGKTDNQGGDNYAVGGARTTVDSLTAVGPAQSTFGQVNRYITAQGGTVDSRGLYSVWTGANDLFAVAAGAPAQATIGTAAAGTAQAVGALSAAGAKYIMVPNIPDLGLTPQFRAGGAVGIGTGTQLSTTYNAAMYAAIAAGGYQVIPVDTFSLLREIVANPGMYGFRNVTGTACGPAGASSLTCNPTSYVAGDAATAYLFADGVHPTSGAHEILADYALSLLEGPRQVSLLSHSAQVTGRARADQVAGHITGTPEQDGLRWWGGLSGSGQRYEHADLYEGAGGSGLFGIDYASGNMVYGGFLGYQQTKQDFGNSGGDFKQKETTGGLFGGWYGEHIWVTGQASYSQLDFDVTRDVHLGVATRRQTGSPEGDNVAFALHTGYGLGDGVFTHGPIASVVAQRVKVDGYSESNPSASALNFGDQDYKSLVGSLGYQASFELDGGIRPYISATYDHEFEDQPKELTASLQSMPTQGEYRVPGYQFDKNYATVTLGSRTHLFGLDANIGAVVTAAEDKALNYSVFATVGGSF